MNDPIVIEVKNCPGCGSTIKIAVERQDYEKWKGGMVIQRAMPYLSKEERERLITGYCTPCWEKLMD